MKTRNEIYGGTFSSPEAPDTNANGELKKLVLSDSLDITKNRSSWIRTIFYNIMDSFTHKTEDRATGSNIGVSGTGIESTQTVYTTPEQLPEVGKVTDDFTIGAVDADGEETATQDMFEISVVNTDRKNKSFNISFSTFAIKWFKVRTWLESDLVTLISATVEPLITEAISEIPDRVAPITSLVVDGSTNTISTTGFVDLTNITYTTPNDGVSRKYQIIFRGRSAIQTNLGETINLQIKMYNSTDSVDYDLTNNYLNNDVGFIQVQENCVLMTVQTILPNKTIKVAALRTGTSNPAIQDCKFMIIEIK